MIVLIIVSVILLLAAVIGLIVFIQVKKDEENDCYDAAKAIIKEGQLNAVIKNSHMMKNHQDFSDIKPMVYLKIKKKKGAKFVFDPKETVNIGRDKTKNQVCVNEALVSNLHCKIYSIDRYVYLQDLFSSNGVYVDRGLKRYFIEDGAEIELFTGDKIQIGTTVICVKIFYFDELYM